MIKLYSVVLKESPLDSPFVPKDKCIWAGIAAAAASILGSGINALSQGSANATNLEATENTNLTNEKLANKTNEMSQAQFNNNMQWLREQYYTNRKYALEDRNYNEPSQVVQRLLNAGVNPASFFGSGSTPVSASSSVGAPSQSQFQAGYHQAGHVDPIEIGDGLSESVMHAFDAYHQNQLIDAQRDKTKIETQISRINATTQLAENIARIRNIYAETEDKLSNKNLNDEQRKNLKKQRDILNNQIYLFMRTMDDQIESFQLSNDRQRREISHIDFEEILAAQKLNIESAMADNNIQFNNAQMSLVLKNVSLIAAQIQSEYERGESIHLDNVAKQIENSLNNMILNNKTFEENKISSNKFLKHLRGFSHYLGDLIIGPILQGYRLGSKR